MIYLIPLLAFTFVKNEIVSNLLPAFMSSFLIMAFAYKKTVKQDGYGLKIIFTVIIFAQAFEVIIRVLEKSI